VSCPADFFVCNPFQYLHGGLLAFFSTFLPSPGPTIVLTVVGVAFITTVLAIIVMSQVWTERRVVAMLQGRLGPNRVGPQGLLQPLADVVKLLLKEDIIPFGADRIGFVLAPIAVVAPALAVWSIIPWGPGLAVTDLNVGVLFVLALGAFATIGIITAGWASNNKYALLGGMRVAAQLISYEIPQVIMAMVPVLLAGTMSLGGIVDAQAGVWNVLVLPVGPIALVVFLVASIAEVNRAPFDLPEAESEIVAGFHIEYSGMRFALFFLAEYVNTFTVGALTTLLFLGGWAGPILPPFVWFFLKTYGVFLVLVWIRGTLPRLRYDQLMEFAWKALLPISFATLALTAVEVTLLK
jgi:NADH-quinone oxidoreductase subunit H